MSTEGAQSTTQEVSTAEKGLDSQERLFRILRQRGALIFLVLMVVGSAVAFDSFFSFSNLENIVTQSAPLGLIVVGMTFVIISGGIDLSVGSMLALGGVLGAYAAGVAWPLALIVPIVVCGSLGLIQGLLIAKANIAFFIVTLAGLLGIRGLVLAITGEQNVPVSQDSVFLWFGQGAILGIPVPMVIALVVFAIGGLTLLRTGYGQAIFSIGDNEDSAHLMGVPVDRTKIIAYTVSGALAGLAGTLLAARLSSGIPVVGSTWELDAIAAVVVGGTILTGGSGTMLGSLAGVLLLGTLGNLINQIGTLGQYSQQVVSGIFLIVVVTLQAFLTRKEGL